MSHFKSSISKLSLVVLTSLAVTACGSSGNGGNSSPVQQLNNSVQPKGTQPNNPVQSKGTQPNNSAQPEQQPNKPAQLHQPQSNNPAQPEQPQSNNPAQPQQPQPNNPAQPQQPQPNNPTQPQQPQPNNPAQPMTPATGSALSVAIVDEQQIIKPVAITDPNITELNVDGQKINLNVGLAPDDIVCCSRFSDSRFGFVEGPNETDYVFYNGNLTRNMPNAGTAEYLGESLFIGVTQYGERGRSEFTVNFGDKTLTGRLDVPSIVTMDVNGRITDNSFTGTATPQPSTYISSSVANVEGKFYGDQAKEMAGLAFPDDNAWVGAFGAQKQN